MRNGDSMLIDEIEKYTTKNLNIAAFLYTSGIHFIRANEIDREFFFEFTPKLKAESLVSDYFSGRATCNPRELFARLHDLKDLIFSQRGSNGKTV